jgi:energy-coupling factor transporter transmembrane protein EcfT
MNAEVTRSEEISSIILLILVSIVRPFVPDSIVWGLAIAQLVVLIRAIPRRDWTTIHLAILLWSLTLFP